MNGLPWFRMYTTFMNDPDIEELAFEDQRHFVFVLCMKCEGLIDHEFKDIEKRERAIARRLGLHGEAFKFAKQRLVESGLINQDWQPRSWDKLQFKSDHEASGAERQRRYRERKRQEKQWSEDGDSEAELSRVSVTSRVTSPVTSRNGRVTLPDTDTDTDTDTDKDFSQTSFEVRAASAPSCPYEKLTDLYRQHFPDQRQPRTDISDRRKAIMRKGWLHASRLKKRDGSGPLYNGDATGVTFWDEFMAWVAKQCDFCMQEQTNFDIEWLFTPRAIDNLIDGKYIKIRERKSA